MWNATLIKRCLIVHPKKPTHQLKLHQCHFNKFRKRWPATVHCKPVSVRGAYFSRDFLKSFSFLPTDRSKMMIKGAHSLFFVKPQQELYLVTLSKWMMQFEIRYFQNTCEDEKCRFAIRNTCDGGTDRKLWKFRGHQRKRKMCPRLRACAFQPHM